MILSIAEFARRAQLDRKTVHHHINHGHLKTRVYTVKAIGIHESELAKLSKIVKRKSYPQVVA